MGTVNEKMIYILDTVEQDIVLKVVSHRNGFQLNIFTTTFNSNNLDFSFKVENSLVFCADLMKSSLLSPSQ